jgi:ABC-2 type transport system ATP-binding protein
LKERHAAGTTILYSSHVLSEVERYCDKVAIVKSGSVIANESIAHFRQKRLKRVAVKCRPEAIDSCAALLRRHASASRVEVHDHFVQMDWHGMPRALTALMDAIDPIDFTVVEPSLETIFMHYYRETTNDSAMALEHPLPNKA